MRRGASRCAPAVPAFVYHRVHGLGRSADDVAHTYVRGGDCAPSAKPNWPAVGGGEDGGDLGVGGGERREPPTVALAARGAIGRLRTARQRTTVTRRKSLRSSAIFVLRGRIAAVVVIVRRPPPARRPGTADTAAPPRRTPDRGYCVESVRRRRSVVSLRVSSTFYHSVEN